MNLPSLQVVAITDYLFQEDKITGHYLQKIAQLYIRYPEESVQSQRDQSLQQSEVISHSDQSECLPHQSDA